ncbi:DEAD/DEAH box helicase [uncultured Jatrophihabitans sp.]|uniref:DEAD/DEAH box helicase n=1 Tax=uncultured Jatrophihabitans sp. TaxID=1610747 RepID=UPI0035CA9C55
MTSFTDLGVPARLNDVLSDLGIVEPTPIQLATVPDALAGRDVLGRGRTGSGKTFAFLLPVVTRLAQGSRARGGSPRALILAPTRELAAQIDAALAPLAAATGLTSRTIFGGVGQKPQVDAIRRGVDILVACPGRLEDLIAQGLCSLDAIEITVLDEADHMADLGFLPAVRRLLQRTPRNGQRLMFSATLDAAVDTLVKRFLQNPAVHEADSARVPVAQMAHHVLQVERDQRLPVLLDLTSAPGRTVVFTRTKHGAKALTRQLNRGGVRAVELHGNLAQNARTRNLDDFHAGRASALIATDIAARGIHVDEVSLVVHADPPADPKAYLHRSGRTARAGSAGTVVTLATTEQRREVRALAKAAGISPTTTSVTSANDPILTTLAPGPRRLVDPAPPVEPAAARSAGRAPGGGGGSAQRRRGGRRRGERPGTDGTGSAAGRTHTSARRTSGRTSNGEQSARRSRGTQQRTGSSHSPASFSAKKR